MTALHAVLVREGLPMALYIPAQVGYHASRPMRPRICRERLHVKWPSARWRMKYRACRLRGPPLLKSRC